MKYGQIKLQEATARGCWFYNGFDVACLWGLRDRLSILGDDPVVATYEYFTVRRLPRRAGRKTHEYWLVNRRQSVELGRIKWQSGWRQFVFVPEGDTIWSAGCLVDVQDFLGKLKSDRARYEE